MFVTHDVDIPDEVMEALENSTLVIFAGAGVSMDPPSNFPNFDQLAEEISMGKIQRVQGEPVDSFLGRIPDSIDVHQKAKDILSTSTSRPNALHTGIFNLFKNKQNLRIVTTNFDQHFSTLIEQQEDKIEIYSAPALPLGDDFTGLVYLHGSTKQDAKKLVLTDMDFGKAYLASGWATRFLQGMFSAYTVIFIGYSLNDPLVRYLSKGLILHPIIKPKCFAFCCEDDEQEKWKDLKIRTITYPLRERKLSHVALPEAINSWVDLNNKSILENDNKIKSIVSGLPNIEIVLDDYIEKKVLKSPQLVQAFIKYATRLEWFYWAVNKNEFKILFTLSTSIRKESEYIAYWITSKIFDNTDDIISIIKKNNMTLNPILWDAIADKLAATDIMKNTQLELTYNTWIEILLRTYIPGCQIYWLTQIGEKCLNSGIAIQIFEFFTRPSVDFSENYFVELYPTSHKVFSEVSLLNGKNEYYFLRNIWEKSINSNIAKLYPRLVMLLPNRLMEIYYISEDIGGIDFISRYRTAIEQSRGDNIYADFDVIIDATRDLLDWIIVNKEQLAVRLLNQWICSEVPILKRIAVYGMCKLRCISNDEKIQWVLENELLHYQGIKHELFKLLGISYNFASTLNQEKVITFSREKAQSEYDHFELVAWLNKNFPTNNCVNQELLEIRKVHPKYQLTDQPDYEGPHITRGFKPVSSTVTPQKLLNEKPEDIADTLLSYCSQIDERYGLLNTISEVASNADNFSWVLQLCEMLQDRKEWKNDMWHGIFNGLQNAELNLEQWNQIFAIIKQHNDINYIAHPATTMILAAIKSNDKISDDWIIQANSVERYIYEILISKDCDKNNSHDDWTTEAINNPGGKIVEYLITGLSILRKHQPNQEVDVSILQYYNEFFDKIIESEHIQAQLGQTILALNIYYLYYLDAEWTQHSLLKLFDVHDEKIAKRSWESYLKYDCRWNNKFLDILLPSLNDILCCRKKEIKSLDKEIGKLISDIVFYSDLSKTATLSLLKKYVSYASEAGLTSFVNYTQQCLMQSPNAVKTIWEKWLKDYLYCRMRDEVKPMSSAEKSNFLILAIYEESIYSEVVQIIIQSPLFFVDNRVYYLLDSKKIGAKYPEDTFALLQYSLKGDNKQFYSTNIKSIFSIVEALHATSKISSREIIDKICELLAGLDNTAAMKLQELYEDR
ncbi:SIR2 family protein [Pectinatus frisingensis]|uniref:SIR2 family protein n=1 Tax=Pectinatus frisingensis TaxID=865 RepID=UPI0018C76DBF|nr:SIR2 family protein [Pectinatus frisingensis]